MNPNGLEGIAESLTKVGNRRDPGRVKVHLVGKGDFAVAPSELPLAVELTFDASSAATRQCARAGFRSLPESRIPSLDGAPMSAV